MGLSENWGYPRNVNRWIWGYGICGQPTWQDMLNHSGPLTNFMDFPDVSLGADDEKDDKMIMMRKMRISQGTWNHQPVENGWSLLYTHVLLVYTNHVHWDRTLSNLLALSVWAWNDMTMIWHSKFMIICKIYLDGAAYGWIFVQPLCQSGLLWLTVLLIHYLVGIAMKNWGIPPSKVSFFFHVSQ